MKKTKRLAAALLTIMAVSTACVAPPKGEAPEAPPKEPIPVLPKARKPDHRRN